MGQRDSERAVIGSLLLENRCIAEVDRTGLSADDFVDDDLRLAFEVIGDLRREQKAYDPVIVANEMGKRKPGDYVPMIAEAMRETPTAANVILYCQAVIDNANRRKLVTALSDASGESVFGDWRSEAGKVLALIQNLNHQEEDIITGADLAASFLDYYSITKDNPENAYCRTGFSDLDYRLGGGMFKSEVYIVGARPGMGKTTLGINIAQNIVNRGKAVLFISLEMSGNQIQAKRIALETGIRYTDLMTGRITPDEEEQMRDWIDGSREKPFYLITHGITVGEIARKARQIEDLSCVIVDYIGLITCAEESRQKPRYEQITEISAGLKATAKELNIPILALCQLNRENTTRQEKRPTMSDLRDSGAIEQDAGAIILLHRPDYYEQSKEKEKEAEDTAPEMEEIELNVAKNRHAEPGLVKMWWNGNVGRISLQSREIAPVGAATSVEDLPF